MRQVSVENLQIIGKGVTATVYATEEDTVIKLFRSVVPREKIEYEKYCSDVVKNLGVNTPAARELVQCGDSLGIVYAKICGVDLAEYINNHTDRPFELGREYGKLVRCLHNKKAGAVKIPVCADQMLAGFDNVHGMISEAERAELLGYLTKVPDRDNVLHGDFSPGNIMVQNNNMYAIDLLTLQKGNPLFDLLQPYAYCHETNQNYEHYLAMSDTEKNGSLGKFLARYKKRYLPQEVKNKVWDGFLCGYFAETKRPDKDEINLVLGFYSAIKKMGSVIMWDIFGEEVVQFLVDRGREFIGSHKKQINDVDLSVFDMGD